MPDRRSEIIDTYQVHIPESDVECISKEDAKDAMDEYMKECCLELLAFMADNDVECERLDNDNEGNEWRLFKYKGKRISAEQLFENFL